MNSENIFNEKLKKILKKLDEDRVEPCEDCQVFVYLNSKVKSKTLDSLMKDLTIEAIQTCDVTIVNLRLLLFVNMVAKILNIRLSRTDQLFKLFKLYKMILFFKE